MARTREDSRRWMQQGAGMVSTALAGLSEQAFTEPTDLPGWTRKHVVAHLSANADAMGNLVHWAATGEPTPMYSSFAQRNADIEAGSLRPGSELTAWLDGSAARLDAAMASLTEGQWAAEVVNAQGRTVPASETPWMRAREVMIHGVDLRTGIGFDDLPGDFLAALCDDIAAKRSSAAGTDAAGPALALEAAGTGGRWVIDGEGAPTIVTGSVAAIASYLSGRGAAGLVSSDGTDAPVLPPWL